MKTSRFFHFISAFLLIYSAVYKIIYIPELDLKIVEFLIPNFTITHFTTRIVGGIELTLAMFLMLGFNPKNIIKTSIYFLSIIYLTNIIKCGFKTNLFSTHHFVFIILVIPILFYTANLFSAKDFKEKFLKWILLPILTPTLFIFQPLFISDYTESEAEKRELDIDFLGLEPYFLSVNKNINDNHTVYCFDINCNHCNLKAKEIGALYRGKKSGKSVVFLFFHSNIKYKGAYKDFLKRNNCDIPSISLKYKIFNEICDGKIPVSFNIRDGKIINIKSGENLNYHSLNKNI